MSKYSDPMHSVHGAEPDWDALARFYAGEASEDQSEHVRAWLAANPRHARAFESLDRIVRDHVQPAQGPAVDVEAALVRVQGMLRTEAGSGAPPPLTRAEMAATRRRWASPWLAAAVLVLAALPLLRVFRPDRSDQSAGAPEVRHATGVAASDTVLLSDGSRVLLGPLSELVVPRGYGAERREVSLRGQALFEVPHDDSRPFVVSAGTAIVRDIGTAFTVIADGRRVRVAVTQGAVIVHRAGEPVERGVVLHERDIAVVPEGSAAAIEASRGAMPAEELAWTRGAVTLRGASMTELAMELRRWYGVELRVEGERLAGLHVDVELGTDPVDTVLRRLELALGATLQRTDSTVVARLKETNGR